MPRGGVFHIPADPAESAIRALRSTATGEEIARFNQWKDAHKRVVDGLSDLVLADGATQRNGVMVLAPREE